MNRPTKKLTNRPASSLKNIHRLLADLLQLVFHPDYHFLYPGMIRLRSGGVNLTPHLLNNETQLLARIILTIDSIHEILAMLTQTNLLFVNIQLLEIINHLLLETTLIRLQLQILDRLFDLRPYRQNPLAVERLHLILEI